MIPQINADKNWVTVCLVAMEFALTGRTYVDYAIRDHILSNRSKIEKSDIEAFKAMIKKNLQCVVVNKRTFWENFHDAL